MKIYRTYRKLSVLIFVMAMLSFLPWQIQPTQAEVLMPINTTLFMQTSGPNAGANVGDYRTLLAGDNLPHELEVYLPCIANTTYRIQIFDPEINITTSTVIDDIRDSSNNNSSNIADADDTTMALLGPNGSTIASNVYTPTGGTDNTWVNLGTVTMPATPVLGTHCGIYIVQSSTSDNDDNSWRLRIRGGGGIPTAAETFDAELGPDGIAGTGDEVWLGVAYTSYQRSAIGCQDFYWFVDDGATNLYMLNFDMDFNTTQPITYTTPSGVAITGTRSGNGIWNDLGNSASRPAFGDMRTFDAGTDVDGDAIANPEPGLWSATICVDINNQYSFEVPGYTFLIEEPPLPDVSILKDDGVTTTTSPGTNVYTLTITNSGLGAAMPIAGPEIVDSLPSGLSFVSCTVNAPLQGTCTENPGGSGNIEIDLVSQSATTLAFLTGTPAAPNNSGTITLTTSVDSGLAPSTTLDNTAAIDWTDLYSNGYAPVEDNDVDTVIETPIIGIAKQAGTVTDVGGGLYDVPLTFTVENLGNVALTNVQVTDNLAATFPGPATFSIQAGPNATGTLTANAGFNGIGDTDLLNSGSSSLAVGATETITVTVRFNPNGLTGPFNNTAVATGESPLGATPTDTSDNGTDPDPDGDGNPDETGENDPTPINYAENPVIGISKEAGTVSDLGGGTYQVDLTFTVENLGNVALSNVQVTDDLTATFGSPATFAVSSGPNATGTLTANGSYDGDTDQNLLNAGSSSLPFGATETITVTVQFTPNGAADPFYNTGVASGEGPSGGTTTDDSDDGADPDPNGNGDPTEPGEDDPTEISYGENPVIGIAKQAGSVTDLGGGNYEVTLTFTVENLGNVDLDNVQVTDDLAATFGAPATFTVSGGPNASGTLTANGAYDGSGDMNLLTAGSSSLPFGATETITVTVQFAPNGASEPFNNTAVASGDSPLGVNTTDNSDNGVDPDPNGNGDPTETGEDDPTPITTTPNILVTVFDPAISKVGILEDGGLGLPGEQLTWLVTITNIGNGTGTDIVVADEIRSELRIDDATVERGTVTISGQTVTFNIPYLDPGESIQMTIVTTVLSSPLDGQFENLATLTGNGTSGTVTTRSVSSVVSVATGLPATGYPPTVEEQGQSLPFTSLLIGLVVALIVLFSPIYLWRRKTRQMRLTLQNILAGVWTRHPPLFLLQDCVTNLVKQFIAQSLSLESLVKAIESLIQACQKSYLSAQWRVMTL